MKKTATSLDEYLLNISPNNGGPYNGPSHRISKIPMSGDPTPNPKLTTPEPPMIPNPEMEHIASFIGRYGPDPDAIVIPVMVEDVEAAAMIDDGATISVVSTRFANLLETMGKIEPYEAQERVRVFGGALVTLERKARIRIGTLRQSKPIDVWISDEVPFDVCLGYDFTKPNHFIIDFEDGTVTMFGKRYGETTIMMTNDLILAKMSQIAQAIDNQDFRPVRTLYFEQ